MCRTPHQRAGTAGMVEMHVGEDDVIHRLARDPHRGQCRQHARHRGIDGGIDQRRTSFVFDHMHRVEQGANEAGIDGMDAVAEMVEMFNGFHAGHFARGRRGLLSPIGGEWGGSVAQVRRISCRGAASVPATQRLADEDQLVSSVSSGQLSLSPITNLPS
jgi:hypothetical protein